MIEPMRRRIVLVGATGVFGERLAHRLARWPEIELVLAARRPAPLAALARRLEAHGASAGLRVQSLHRADAANLAPLAPFAMVDCAGPFQSGDYDLARAALAMGAHYLDIADGRAFARDFPAALDAEARQTGRVAITGASSSPALCHAAVDHITRGWTRIDTLSSAISPGSRAPRGLSVIRAILSWAGQPVHVFRRGEWQTRAGWSLLHRAFMPGLGRRWLSLAETPDLDLLPARFRPTREGLFLAGLELSILHLGLWVLTWAVRLKALQTLEPLAATLRWIAGGFAGFGSDVGGMTVAAEGIGPDGTRRRSRWALWVEAGAGPNTPILPAAAVLRALIEERAPKDGAYACVGVISLEDILREGEGLPIHTHIDEGWPDDASLHRRLIGGGFDQLPQAVREIHDGRCAASFTGAARVRGAGGLAAVSRLMAGLPSPGVYSSIRVDIQPEEGREIWTRRFGSRRFQSSLNAVDGEIGVFQEAMGLLKFRFAVEANTAEMRWRFLGWDIGPLPLPRALAPRIRARISAPAGRYRFAVVVSHPWIGLIVAYAGWIETEGVKGSKPAG
jgi:hypothetical protein